MDDSLFFFILCFIMIMVVLTSSVVSVYILGERIADLERELAETDSNIRAIVESSPHVKWVTNGDEK